VTLNDGVQTHTRQA